VTMIINQKQLPIAVVIGVVVIGAAIFDAAGYLVKNNSDEKISTLEHKIRNLESLLVKKEDDLKNMRLLAMRQNGKNDLASSSAVTEICNQVQNSKNNQNQFGDTAQASVYEVQSSLQVLKNLGTNSANDPRSFSEKANDLLSGDSSKEKVAIVSKGIFDMANDRENLPDYTLQTMYNNQTDPDLKRVIAQVLSNRGNNALIDNQITEAQTRLRSENPSERQHALTNLAKTHSSSAANAIAPLLDDANIDVKLDALLALRATGNQTHVSLVEKLLNDPDPSVSSLATQVVADLKNLSDSARTMLSIADIAAELPMMENP